ncbi:DUF2164 domain-containing protein [Paenibacillus harenae]|uniref:DUF2164 domain-containing protein n=1 Tax=Paenibacillus harenae TaxID=306543 RepID=UPI0027927DF8|nr:DUF2164 domain-containing protein [Paenibacillus harenae]MDQ0059261.1 uncharacterized protein (DUF2164 family) [Paenibacillus harenae]
MQIIKLPKEQMDKVIGNIQQFFELERSETIGSIAAEQLLDMMLKELAPYVYNGAISDARKAVFEKMQTLEDELYALEKPIMTKRS